VSANVRLAHGAAFCLAVLVVYGLVLGVERGAGG
jgi:hypothetical protein